MVKKKFFAVMAAMAVMCALEACGTAESATMIPEEIIATEENMNESVTMSSEESMNESGAMSSEEMETESDDIVTESADGNDTESKGNYGIESYQSIQDFSYQLFSENMEHKNPVLSPASVYLALTMAGLGSGNNTKTQFQQVLGEDMVAISDNLMHTLPVDSENQVLSLANSAWIDDEYSVDEKWTGTIKSVMNAEAYQTDLASVEAMNSMNNWIKENTNGLIDKMLAQPLSTEARLALFNTIYFKGKWCNPFDANDTYADTFRIDDKGQVETDMMHKYSEYLDYVSNDFAEGLILPYQAHDDSHNLAMLVLKPKDMDVRELYRNLDADTVSELISNKQNVLINTKLPKFETSFEYDLNDSLINMGLTDSFDSEKADFSLMGRNESGNNLYIGLVKQKAKIIVDEEGTEAAAATAVIMLDACALVEEEPIDVFFDEPFLYMIVDMDKEIPLFLGIFDDPSEITD